MHGEILCGPVVGTWASIAGRIPGQELSSCEPLSLVQKKKTKPMHRYWISLLLHICWGGYLTYSLNMATSCWFSNVKVTFHSWNKPSWSWRVILFNTWWIVSGYLLYDFWYLCSWVKLICNSILICGFDSRAVTRVGGFPFGSVV